MRNEMQILNISEYGSQSRQKYICLLLRCLCKMCWGTPTMHPDKYVSSKQALFVMCMRWRLFQHGARDACCLLLVLLMIWISCPSLRVPAFSQFPSFSLTHTHTHTHLCFLSAFLPAHAALWLCSPVWIIALSRLSWSYTNNICQLIYHCSPPVVHSRLFIYALFLHPCLQGEKKKKRHVTSSTENNPQKSCLIFVQILGWCLTGSLTPVVFHGTLHFHHIPTLLLWMINSNWLLRQVWGGGGGALEKEGFLVNVVYVSRVTTLMHLGAQIGTKCKPQRFCHIRMDCLDLH